MAVDVPADVEAVLTRQPVTRQRLQLPLVRTQMTYTQMKIVFLTLTILHQSNVSNRR